MLIDFHTHCFPEKIAEKAILRLSYVSGGIPFHTNGTFSGLKNIMDRDGVDISCVLNIATNPRQMKNVNDFAASIDGDGIVAFGSVHPEAEDALEELERIKSMGLRGIKFHPDYQSFRADDPKMKPIYKKASELGLVVIFHAGKDFGYPAPYGGTPDALLTAHKWLDTPMVAAHWGGLGMNEEVLEVLAGEDIYFDTSYSSGAMARPMLMKIVEKHGCDHLLFGTDMPWHTPATELGVLDTLELTAEEKEKVLWKNAAGILKLNL